MSGLEKDQGPTWRATFSSDSMRHNLGKTLVDPHGQKLSVQPQKAIQACNALKDMTYATSFSTTWLQTQTTNMTLCRISTCRNPRMTLN